ncbi:hypothetical protein JW756_00330 [Candidatus Woesearchaeota archaeon]|nr:hypothetical protein [Candidatus Woesearchaeota archaeon]
MRKTSFITMITTALIALALLLLVTSCMPKQPTDNIPDNLFNDSINQGLEDLTENVEPVDNFIEFMFNYTTNPEAKYEIARDDIFTLSKGNFTSTEIAFFGVMLGDSYESVIEKLGIPDVMFIPADESYKNMEYRNRIGIEGKISGLTYHLENNTVTAINVKTPFTKYMQGNTTLGQTKESIYALLDVPDYQDFVSTFRVFHYIEKGMDLYFKASNVDRMSFFYPKEFKGVKYVTVLKEIEDGIFTNVTEPVLIE